MLFLLLGTLWMFLGGFGLPLPSLCFLCTASGGCLAPEAFCVSQGGGLALEAAK